MRITMITGAVLLVMAAAPARAETPVERGAYLVGSILTCNNCHTPRGPNGPQFDKLLSGGDVFDTPGFTVSASNITPDKEAGIGAWSDDEIKQTLRTGIRPNGIPLAPVMPTIFYGAFSEADLSAVVAYLRSVPANPNKVPSPVYRASFPHVPYPGAEKPMADSGSPAERGRYLATIGHCMDCHTPMVRGVQDFATKAGVGGREFSGPFGKSISANITSDPEKGLGKLTDAQIKTAITQGIAPDGHRLLPPMGYAYYAKMTPADLDALVAWLRTLPPNS